MKHVTVFYFCRRNVFFLSVLCFTDLKKPHSCDKNKTLLCVSCIFKQTPLCIRPFQIDLSFLVNWLVGFLANFKECLKKCLKSFRKPKILCFLLVSYNLSFVFFPRLAYFFLAGFMRNNEPIWNGLRCFMRH